MKISEALMCVTLGSYCALILLVFFILTGVADAKTKTWKACGTDNNGRHWCTEYVGIPKR